MLMGMPVETTAPSKRTSALVDGRPVITWGLTAVCCALFLILFVSGTLGAAFERFGFVPAEPLRHAGIPLLMSFLLHAGFMHIVGNMYFLMVFGDNVESDLGRRKYALLVLASHVVGVLAHALVEPRSSAPLIGASAGISGVVAYYAIAFPRARLGMLLWVGYWARWVRVPALLYLGFWFLLQLIGLMQQVEGMTNVSAAGHVGGAAVGVAAALVVRHRRRELTAEPSRKQREKW